MKTIWLIFIIGILLLLSLDLFVFNRKGKEITNKRAAIFTVFWIAVALSFSFGVYYIYKFGFIENINNLTPDKAVLKYISGYLIELSLSVDNLFVIAIIFGSFNIPIKYQHKTLFWGIIGAIVFRAIMIFAGVILINKISWMTYVFGGILMYTAIRMIVKKESHKNKERPKWLDKIIRIDNNLDGEKFWTVKNGKRFATPLFAALIIIELSDVLFAVDSIPAILAVTTDPFIVFSSNIFAILGLRSMYFFLANMLEKFKYLKHSVIVILIYVSIKLLISHHFIIPEWISLSVILVSLLTGVIISRAMLNKVAEN